VPNSTASFRFFKDEADGADDRDGERDRVAHQESGGSAQNTDGANREEKPTP